MAKQSQVLQLDPPSELIFKGPFTDVVTTALILKNPTTKSICFKVKTTAPKQYCVRPNSGIIPTNGSVQVSIMLQPFDSSTDSLERGKHKFMVQSVFVADGEQSLENIWKNTPASEFMESKLRVVFDHPEMNDAEKLRMKTSSQSQSSANQESDVRRQVDENKRLQHRLQMEEAENVKLKDRVRKLEGVNRLPQSFTGDGGSLQSAPFLENLKLMHLVMAIFVALFIGILFGRLIR